MDNQRKIAISLFDYSGNWVKPYRENGWDVVQVDLKRGIDILTWDYKGVIKSKSDRVVVLAAVPCTDYALSGAAWFEAKDENGTTGLSNRLVKKTFEIVKWFSENSNLIAWTIENPKSRIHKLNPEIGEPALKFNPCDYAGYDPIPEDSRYNKETWLWGEFNLPDTKRMSPLQKEFPGFLKYGGKSEHTKEMRSITPLGFAYAFYAANHTALYQQKLFV